MIIGISGVAGTGKDTCADFLVRDHGFVKVALADPLKRAARDFFDFSVEQLWGPSAMRNAPDERYPRDHTLNSGHALWKWCTCCGIRYMWSERPDPDSQCYLTPRYALQQLGTEYGRNCFPDVWISYALRVAAKLSVEGGYSYTAQHGLEHHWRPGDDIWHTPVVVPDIRFKNEVAAFRKAGAKLVRVVRPGAGLSGSSGQHVSETQQGGIPDSVFDVIITNNGTLEELREKVRLVAS